MHLSPLPAAVTAVVLFISFPSELCESQSVKRCEGDVGETGWICDSLTPINPDVWEEFLPIPDVDGSGNGSNPVMYKKIGGDNATATSSSEGTTAVYALTEGAYFCMLAESRGEAVLFDAPEASFTSSFGEKFPNGTWLTASIDALLSEGTKLKYIVYTHRHWDHMGAAGLVAEYFAADNPTAIASRRTRLAVKKRDTKDPNTVFGNNRGVPIPEWYQEEVLEVGGLRFMLEKAHAHQAGDLMVTLDKHDPQNAGKGIDSTIFMVTDTVFAGWAPFYSVNIVQDVSDFLEALDEINGKDFDILVGGHLTRLGTKADVQRAVDFFADVVAGGEAGNAAVTFPDVIAGTGVTDPTNPNFGNTWLVYNEVFERIVDVCETYVLDVSGRGRDWLVELAGTEITLRSQCWTIMNWAYIA